MIRSDAAISAPDNAGNEKAGLQSISRSSPVQTTDETLVQSPHIAIAVEVKSSLFPSDKHSQYLAKLRKRAFQFPLI
jgi:hypothetical protein